MMPRRRPRRTLRSLSGTWALLAMTLLGALACDPVAAGPPGRQGRALVGDGLGLAPPASWRRLALDRARLVTPRWSPGGDLLLLRGGRGIGLYVVSAADGELVHAEEGYRGDAAFTTEGDALCRGPVDGAWAVDLSGGEAASSPCTVAWQDERFGERLHHGSGGAVYHDAYAGTVTRVSPDGEVAVVEDRGAFQVAVSADGRRIAWVLGTLAEPELFVHDEESGLVSLGRGAQPSWGPEGRVLVFTVPRVRDRSDGSGASYEADLHAFDADRRQVTRLTDTPDIAEMQPTVAPDGRSLAFADWEGGVVYVAAVTGLGRAGGAP